MGTVYVNNTGGILLNAADRPLITRGWDAFTSGVYSGVGRWGLFMENSSTVLGLPAGGSGRRHQFVSYNADSTVNTVFMTIVDSGNVGIGTNSPSNKLHVSGGNIQLSNSGTRSSLIISGGVSSGQGSKIQIIGGGGGSSSVEIDMTTYDPGANDPTSRIRVVDENFSSNILFQTKTPGAGTNTLATRMYIRNDGNIGVGTTTPGKLLEINGDVQLTGLTAANLFNSSSAFLTNLSCVNNTLTNIRAFNMTSTLITSSNIVFTNSTIVNALITTCTVGSGGLLINRNTSGWNPGLYLRPPGAGDENYMIFNNNPFNAISVGSWLVGTPGGVTGGTFQIGFANTTYAFNIMTSGNIGIGTATPSNQLTLSTDSAAKPSTNTWTISSDERLKTNITQANLDICYDNVKNIPLKRYTWRDEIYTPEEVPDRSKLGWIAQDVEMFIPKAVEQKNMHGYSDCRTLNSDQIIASLYGAVQKLIIEVETLKSQLNNN